MIHYWPSPTPADLLAPCGVALRGQASGFAALVDCPDCLKAIAPKTSWPPPRVGDPGIVGGRGHFHVGTLMPMWGGGPGEMEIEGPCTVGFDKACAIWRHTPRDESWNDWQ